MPESGKIKLLIAAGGTGGHLFPAVAVLEQLNEITGGSVEAHFVGSKGKIESRIAPEMGHSIHYLPISGYFGMMSLKTFLLPAKIFTSIMICRRLIVQHKIDLVLCAGAYLSYPAGFAAGQKKTPLMLMESNVNPGKVIKLLAPRADLIITAFEETSRYLPVEVRHKILPIGNPVRGGILNMPGKTEAQEKFGLNPGKKTILIFGGSLGSASINKAAEKAIGHYKNSNLQFIWQAGRDYNFQGNPDNVKAFRFIDDMASAYAAADLVISRSGATTVAELAIAGKPSALVPYPSASNNEQRFNAMALEEKGAAVMLTDYEIEENIIEIIFKLLNDENKLEIMGKAALERGKPGAAKIAAEKAYELAAANKKSK